MYKRSKYGKLPAIVAEEIPWNKISVYIIDHMGLNEIPIYVILKKENK